MAFKRILVAEGSPSIGEVLQAASASAGEEFDVIEVGTGRQALDYVARQGRVDLILLDLALPDMKGDDFLKALRRINHSLSVVILTSHGQAAPELEGHGPSAVLLKPISSDALRSAIKQALSAERKPESLSTLNPADPQSWARWRKSELARARERIRNAQQRLLADGVIDKKGRRRRSETPVDMRKESKSDVTT